MLFIISKKGLFKLNICLNYICSCSLFAAGQVTVRTPYVRGYLRVELVLIVTDKKVKKSNLQPKQRRQIRESPAPISKTSSRSFQNERDSESTQPIFKIKTESVREKVHLSFAARRFFKSGVNFQKISFENRLHTNKGRFYCIFKFKGIVLILV